MDSHILSWTGIWCNAPQLRNRSSISLRMMCSNTGAIIAAGTVFLAVTKVAVLFMQRSVPSAVESRRVRANYSRI
ncbi:MAG: hypothetical protein WCI85_16015, partial [Comamonadaceae bacterium]